MNKWLPGLVFWGWNAVFLLFIALILFTGLVPAIFMATMNGDIPISFVFSLLLIIAIPVLTVMLAARRKNRTGAFLLRLFFGFELPIFLAALTRLFVLRQMTPGAALLLVSILVACAYFLWTLYDGKNSIRGRLAAMGHAIPSTIMLVFGAGTAAFLLLYTAPSAVGLFKFIWTIVLEILSFRWLSNLGDLFVGGYFAIIGVVFLVLFIFSGLVFIVAPLFMAKYYGQTWRDMQRHAAPHIGSVFFFILSLVTGAMWIGGYAMSGHQQEAVTVAWLQDQETLANVRDDIEAQREDIRRDLLNTYLFRYRYLQTRKDTDGIARLYRKQVGFSPDAANAVETLHRFILTPLLYSGEGNDDAIAGKLYQQIFDAPIQNAERVAIKRTLQATWNRDEVEAGLLDIDSRKVFISEQHINIEEFPTHASVEIEEIYENKTGLQQEIYYYFSLPEDAAVTGLWLGFGDDRSKHDKFVIAPRGAAQEVYEQEVQRRVDPALLEQVGPRQYRLRAYPVPPKSIQRIRRPAPNGGDRLHMRFTYAVPIIDGEIPAPVLLEKRNAYWSKKTVRTLNGAAHNVSSWLPPTIKAGRLDALETVIVALKEGFLVSQTKVQPDLSRKSLAVLIDTSWSVREHDAALKEQLASLQQNPTIEAEVFLIGANGAASTNTPLSKFQLDQQLSYFGSLSPQQILTKFQSMTAGRSFDAVIILTDQSQYLADPTFEKGELDAPLWFVHLGLSAFAYDDAILDLIYGSGGGAAGSFDEALRGMRVNATGARLSGDRVWAVETTETTDATDDSAASSGSPSLNAIAARQVAVSLTRDAKTDLATLDEIHGLAVAHEIITPWSSMIVLVNERQRKALEEASKEADRFAREANTGEETLTAPTVTGVPEPHEWMLMIVASLMLLLLWRRQKMREA